MPHHRAIAYILRWGPLYLHPEAWESGQRGCRRFTTRQDAKDVLRQKGAEGMARVAALVPSSVPGTRVVKLTKEWRGCGWYAIQVAYVMRVTVLQREAQKFPGAAEAWDEVRGAARDDLSVVRLTPKSTMEKMSALHP